MAAVIIVIFYGDGGGALRDVGQPVAGIEGVDDLRLVDDGLGREPAGIVIAVGDPVGGGRGGAGGDAGDVGLAGQAVQTVIEAADGGEQGTCRLGQI